MNSATFFSDAARTYEAITKVLQEVGDQFEGEIGKKDFSSKRFLAQFDLLLQLVLFKTGIADGKLSENEALAIQELPQYGDLLALLSDGKKDKKVHWEDFVKEDVATLVNFTRLAESAADGIIRNFFSPIAFVDEETNGEERFFLLVAHVLREDRKIFHHAIHSLKDVVKESHHIDESDPFDRRMRDIPLMSVGYIPTPLFPASKHVHLVGDCAGIGNLRSVVWKAYKTAMDPSGIRFLERE